MLRPVRNTVEGVLSVSFRTKGGFAVNRSGRIDVIRLSGRCAEFAPLLRPYCSRRSRRPDWTRRGIAILAVGLHLEGFLAVFAPPVTQRTGSPRREDLPFINQRLIDC